MEKEFVPYNLSLRMKQLGFDEPCFRYEAVKKICENQAQPGGCQLPNVHCGYPACTIDSSVESLPIPVWQQAFRWFREKHGLCSWIERMYTADSICYYRYTCEYKKDPLSKTHEVILSLKEYDNYEEAELVCLEKLIEIVESKSE
jgi:hypothetical protein